MKTQAQNVKSSSKWELWLRSYGLKSRCEMPEHMCPNKYIIHGYRPSSSSWTYCLKSLFYPTNETLKSLNVWSHAISLFVMANHYWNFACLYPDYLTNPIFYPYWVFVVGVITVFTVSCFSHLFNCKSPAMYDTCFCYDYASFSLHGMGMISSFGFYLCSYSCVGFSADTSSWISVITSLASPVGVVCLCLTRYPTIQHKHILRVLTCAVFVLVPNLAFVYKVGNDATSLVYSVVSVIVLIFAGFFQGSHYPESCHPGKFDIVGHSHQLFHLSVAFTIYFQTLLIEGSLTEWVDLLQTWHAAQDLLTVHT
ncbi:membrane progesterone receptor epsilon-like isoform X2 [Clavelina lepadiformis]|uniref:membrane progesterone receptor epsilon-like isoform X2 n=1 Tax=Clavelina lepadiformis TaxID=159417 RepID=UPI0040438C79